MNTQKSKLRDLSRLYRDQGIVTIGRLLTDEQIQEIRQNAKRYLQRVVPRLPVPIRDRIVRYEADGISIRSCS